MKNTEYVVLRPSRSDALAHTKRPPMLNSDSSAVNPAAMAAMAPSWPLSRSPKALSSPIKWPPNTSCSMGLAMPITPIPALTFMHSAIHTSQNCGMPQTLFTCTWSCVIMVLCLSAAGGVQPVGFQLLGGTR